MYSMKHYCAILHTNWPNQSQLERISKESFLQLSLVKRVGGTQCQYLTFWCHDVRLVWALPVAASHDALLVGVLSLWCLYLRDPSYENITFGFPEGWNRINLVSIRPRKTSFFKRCIPIFRPQWVLLSSGCRRVKRSSFVYVWFGSRRRASFVDSRIWGQYGD